ncbi:MAG TPA: TetR/AcrR family transcriptional regulator [Treponemataceae bacterium]|nr:TetR/AcrR family transcriptional regulator [Treponemataceae bacterium]
MQTLKNEIRERILSIAEDSFYDKGFRETTMRAIASEVGISVSNLYLYFENKEIILSTLIDSFCASLLRDLKDFLDHRDEDGKDRAIGALLRGIIARDRKKLVIAVEKSQGTQYAAVKDRLIAMLEAHILGQMREEVSHDPLIPYFIAKSFIEGTTEIAKNSENEGVLETRLSLFATYHMSGMRPFL